MNQIDLNQKLYNECCKERIDSEKINELLRLGADPLGTTSAKDKTEHLYAELVDDNANLYEITKIFIKNGMNIKHSAFKNDGDDIDPLWDLAFRCDEEGIKTLKLLLDNDVDFYSIEEFIDHVYTDYLFIDRTYPNDEKEKIEGFGYAMKMLMVCASYEYILKRSDYLKSVIELKNNDYDVAKFKDYTNFDVIVKENSFCFIEKERNMEIWRIKFEKTGEKQE